MINIPRNLDNLSPQEKRAILAELMQEKARKAKSFSPLSYGQQALWFLHQNAPENAVYNVVFTACIRSYVDIPALQRAFQALSDRHPSLRTTFKIRDGEPVQEVHAYQEVCFEQTDAATWNWDELNEQVLKAYQRPFNLESGPLMRVSLFTRSVQEHILVVTIHHIVCDGWSFWMMGEELPILYSAARNGAKVSLPPLELTYIDYVRWQAQMLASAEGENLWAYWQKQLAGELPLLDLPTDRPRPPLQTYRGASHTFELTNELTQQLQRLAQGEGATLYMTILAVFQVLLHRYTGEEDILVGSPTAGRNQPELAEFVEVVGYFVNPIVLRGNLSGNPSFKAFLAQVRGTVLSAIAHENYPFLLLVKQIQPKRDLSRSPIFQVSFVLQKPPQVHKNKQLPAKQTGLPVDLGELSLEAFEIKELENQFDLTLEILEGRGALSVNFKYNVDLFDATTIARMAGHFQTLLEAIVTNPELRLSELPILTEKQRQQLLVYGNDTKVDYPQDKCIHQLFEAQVERTPDDVAVVVEGRRLTYSELNCCANKLAHYLQELGVRQEVLVGICLERSWEMVVGLLGILKAGGAYIPLDPAYPSERLNYIISDAGIKILLTQQSLQKLLSEHQARVVCLDADWSTIDLESKDNPVSEVTPENLAYVIYTSGSTGKPKGVQICHRSVVNFLYSMQQQPGLKDSDVLLAVTTISFDIAILELFLPLVVGARVVLVSREVAADGMRLQEWLIRSGATVMQATPATWRLLLASGWQGTRNLKILCGGEALTPELADRLLERGASVWNLYGPTETTIWSAVCNIRKQDARTKRVSEPIGHPIANTQIYILDRHFQPVPIGISGEIYIGGAGLARGYLNRPQLTAEKFISNPFSDLERLYKTGDIGCYRADGSIEIKGRSDNQIKIRGFRIELEEIEAVLASHPAVQECAVVVKGKDPEQFLVAYWVSASSLSTDSDKIRVFLRERLPNYMVPARFICLEKLPLTPNGKIDRRSLQESSTGFRSSDSKSPLPKTAIEQQIAQVWQAVLQIDRVGIYDNFFDLGGHSLTIVQVHEKLRKDYPELTIVDLFQYPTIHALTEKLTPKEDVAVKLSLPSSSKLNPTSEIAIVGMSLRYPDSRNPMEFWNNLRDGLESIKFFSDEEILRAGVEPELLQNPQYVKAGAVLDDIELFDAEFFGMTPREAELMDPQQRLFLECAWEALEGAGYVTDSHKYNIGVFAGSGMNGYLLNNLYPHRHLFRRNSSEIYQIFIENDKDFLPTRVSYKLNLKGPSIAVQTGCSTGLVAVHLACQSLRHGECDIALAGSVSIQVQQGVGYWHQQGMIFSPDGHCRAFDERAQGTVASSGVGVVILKPLAAALADGDRIHAVIKGSAVNNDGANKVGFTAPGVEGQVRVITEAHRNAGVTPDSIGYVEAHGTGTALGDPIELAALNQAFGKQKTGYCTLGSVKTNIGHTDTAAGMAGLIKTVLALENKAIPPSLHCQQPHLALANSPFYVNTQLSQWHTSGQNPRRAGVSSFGIGGTNAHLVLEEAPPPIPSSSSRSWQLLVLSAKTPSALAIAATNLRDYLKSYPDVKLADVAFTLSCGRKYFNYRYAAICRDVDEACALLEQEPVSTETKAPRNCVFMFAGQGSQYVGMGQELYETEPVFRDTVDYCADFLAELIGCDLRSVLYPSLTKNPNLTDDLERTQITQPALFVVEYALAQLWLSWGVSPTAAIGHSIGEYVAACLAGVFSLEDALTVIALRGRLMQSIAPGAMLAVALGEEEIAPLLSPHLSLAVINGPSRCVIAGNPEAIDELQGRLKEQGVEHRCLRVSHAFHSHLVEPILAKFAKHLSNINLNPPTLPYLSNVTGTWVTAEQATDPEFWVRHLRHTVRFSEGLEKLLQDPAQVLLEIGPGRTLTTLAKQHPDRQVTQVVLHSLRHPQEQQADSCLLLQTLGQLWMAGIDVDWNSFYANERRCRLPLPTHPFQRQRYWIDPPQLGSTPSTFQDNSEVGADRISNSTKISASHTRPQLSRAYTAPRNDLERSLADIWSQCLGIEEIGIFDDFFELGGDSLIATQVISRISERYRSELPLRILFEAPTINSLSDRITAAQQITSDRVIEKVSCEGDNALSFSQMRLWFLAQLEGQSATYNMPFALRVEGELNPSALEKSIQEIIDRHEILRTRFPSINGQPLQVIESLGEWHLLIIDLQPLEPEEREIELQQRIEAEMHYVFDIANSPLFRAQLLQTGLREYVVLVNMHHIISDGWSLGVFVRELSILYQAITQDRPNPLAPLAIQYADFAVWQRQRLMGEKFSQAQDYWRRQLQDIPELLALPTDRPRPRIKTFKGATQPIKLEHQLTQSLNHLSHSNSATLFMTLLSAFALLLGRYTEQTDIVIGSPIANRLSPQLESLIGFFVNTLALRIELSGDPTYIELLGRVRQMAMDAYAHQEFPFEQLVEDLQPQRSLSYSPIFQVMFVLQNTPIEYLQIPDVNFTLLDLPSSIAKFDLTLSLQETGEGLVGFLEYNTDLFEQATIERLAEHWQTLLRNIVCAPNSHLSQFSLMTQTEQDKLLIEWNNTKKAYPQDKCFHEIFEAQVQKNPASIALVFEDQTLSYGELNYQADRVANYLINLGVGCETLIGLCVPRSPATIVGLLGILKAGAAYVPLDPEYPQSRLDFIIQDANISIIVTQSHLLQRFSNQTDVLLIKLDVEMQHLEHLNGKTPKSQVTPNNLAYVIYTSGSTGQPKGVLIEHRGLVNLAQYQQQRFSVTPESRVLQFASLNFDASIWEVSMALTSGASLYLGSKENLQTGLPLTKFLTENAITHATLPPSSLTVMDTACLTLPYLIVAGEDCSVEIANKWSEGRHFFNAYGPTETTVCATVFECCQQLASKVPIGHPIDNVEIYILDPQMQPVPIGVPGELYIGGDSLARGYLHRPELTEKRFVANPFTNKVGTRLYKTGDLCCYLPDGNIEFLGRLDNQVKIRGFRIELGEIESVLASHETVLECAAMANKNQQLIVFWVAQPNQFVDKNQLQAFLRERLPDYLQPSVWVTLDRLPTLPNGKIDRQTLSQMSIDSLDREDIPPVTARTQTEWQLIQIFEKVLKVSPIGIRNDFFDLGGHSLLAIQLITEIDKQLNVTLPVSVIFQAPTVEQLAGIIEQNAPLTWPVLVPIQSEGSATPFFCVPGVTGHVLGLQELARHLGQTRPFYGLQAVGLDGESTPHNSVEAMAANYIREIQNVQPQGPYLLGGQSFGGYVAFEMAIQLQNQGQEVAVLALFDVTAPNPDLAAPRADWDEANWLLALTETIEKVFDIELNVTYEKLKTLTNEEQITYLYEHFSKTGLLPPTAQIKWLRGLIQVYKAGWQMQYTPKTVAPLRLSLFKASEQPPEVSQYVEEPTMGWTAYASQVDVYAVAGDHFSMLRKPHVQELANQLKYCIDR